MKLLECGCPAQAVGIAHFIGLIFHLIQWLLGMKRFFSVRLIAMMLLGYGVLIAGTTGKLTGLVTDKNSGEALVGANIVVEGTGFGAATDSDGYFAIINIPPGEYQVSVFYVGYAKTTISRVNINVDRTTTQKIQLTPETVSGETVLVESERPAVEMDRTHSASIIDAETVELMPVTEVDEVIALQAGVVNLRGQLHFRGGREREVAYIIDGIPTDNAYSQSGGRNVTVENSMIEELEVISGTFNAEYGSAQSGIVNIVTKRPEQTFSGNLRAFSGEWISDQSDVYLGIDDIDPFAEQDLQFSLTGPLLSDKMGFFVSGRYNNWESLNWFERRFNSIDGWRIAAYQRWFQQSDPDGAEESGIIRIPDSLSTGDLGQGPLSTGEFGSLTAKLSFFLHPKVTMTYQAFGSMSESQGAGSSRRYQPDEVATSRSWAHSHFLRFQHFPTENFFYNLALSYQHNDGESFYRKDNRVALFPGDDGIQPISSSSNGFSLGSTPGFFTGADGRGFRDLYQVNGDFNWQIDKHNFIKAGFIVKQHQVNDYFRNVLATNVWENFDWPLQTTINGADYEFNEYWDLLVGYWRNWEVIHDTVRYVSAADSLISQFRDYTIDPLEAAFYVQDKIELGDIIVNAGVRLDYFQPNERVPINYRTESSSLGSDENLQDAGDKLQLSPRFGISFPISANGAFHAAYGHFFQMPSFEFMYNRPLSTFTGIQLTGLTLGNADLKPERTIAYEIGLQQALNEEISVDVTAYYKDFRNLLGIEQLNTIDGFSYNRFINRDYGDTKGITVSVNKLRGLVTGGMNYTFSNANGSYSDPQNLELIATAIQYGSENEQFVARKILRLDWDQRHTFNAYLNFSQRGNWSVGLVGFYASGVPYSPTFIERFDLTEREFRNTANQPNIWRVDLKAQKHLKLFGVPFMLFGQVDNVFDHLNEESVFSSTGRADEIARLPDEEALLIRRLSQEGLFVLPEVDAAPGNFSPPRRVQIGMAIDF